MENPYLMLCKSGLSRGQSNGAMVFVAGKMLDAMVCGPLRLGRQYSSELLFTMNVSKCDLGALRHSSSLDSSVRSVNEKYQTLFAMLAGHS